jgi:hypothetical protein
MQWTGNVHRIEDSPQTEVPTIYFIYIAAIKYYPGIVGKSVAINVGLTQIVL